MQKMRQMDALHRAQLVLGLRAQRVGNVAEYPKISDVYTSMDTERE